MGRLTVYQHMAGCLIIYQYMSWDITFSIPNSELRYYVAAIADVGHPEGFVGRAWKELPCSKGYSHVICLVIPLDITPDIYL